MVLCYFSLKIFPMNLYTVPGPGVPNASANFIYDFIAAISCYSCIFPIVAIDIFIWQFQNIYFRTFDIPLIQRKKYVIVDRYTLGKLTFFQKFNCAYCEYSNGVIAYAKAVLNQMELYSCAIKHAHHPLGQEHQKEFYEREKFE